MIGFIIKKNFYDGWDNLFGVVIANVIFLFAGIGLIFLNAFSRINLGLEALAFVFSCIVLSIIAFAYGDTAAQIAEYNGTSILDFFKAIPGVLKDAALFGVMIALIIIVSAVGLDYYFLQRQSLITAFLGALLLWVDIFILFSLQWFIPIRSLMHNNFRKCLKKSFIIFFDNTGFSVAMGLYNFVLMILSVVCVGFFPSMAGISISCTNALRLRLYKYDYLEEHPELTTKKERKQIPWEELLYEDKEITGTRTLRDFLFPWKAEQK